MPDPSFSLRAASRAAPRPRLSALAFLFVALLVPALLPPRLLADEPASEPAASTAKAASDPPASEADTEPAGDEPPPRLDVYDRIEVRTRGDSLLGIADAASEGSTGAADLALRPILRPGSLLETVPGLIATQHSGGGKANQYFVRGFNLDHGTDLALTVGGVPVNMPSHGHGQGYADANFLIPELVERVRFRKGPYAAASGDFSAAGAIDVDLVRSLPKGILELAGGSHGFARVLVAESFALAGGDLVAALDVTRDDGPWRRPDDLEHESALLRYSRGDAARGFALTAMGYEADWLSTDQVPRRTVESGLIDRFGLIDPGPRGDTGRYSLAFEAHRGDARRLGRLGGYLLAYDLDLVSNFTYFLDDPEQGDQFRQRDDRRVAGLDASRQWVSRWRGRAVELATGVRLRYDEIDNGLYRTRDLVTVAVTREDAVEQLTGGPWGAATVAWNDWLRTTVGLRADYYRAAVRSDRPVNSGTEEDLLLSPKLGAVFGPWADTELYFDLGYGFHSNDARGTTIRVDPRTGDAVDRVPPLVRARGAELGVRTLPLPGLQTTVSLFVLELDSELVFVGDAGATEAGRPSRRTGVEWTNHYRVTPEVVVDLDVAWSDARFTDHDPAGDRIPGALETVVAAGVSLPDLDGWVASVRLRYFDGYPLLEDGSVRAGTTALLDAELGYRFASGLRLSLEGFNLLDREDSDVEYYYASRLPGEPAGGVEDVHFHPVESASVRLALGWRF